MGIQTIDDGLVGPHIDSHDILQIGKGNVRQILDLAECPRVQYREIQPFDPVQQFPQDRLRVRLFAQIEGPKSKIRMVAEIIRLAAANAEYPPTEIQITRGQRMAEPGTDAGEEEISLNRHIRK